MGMNGVNSGDVYEKIYGLVILVVGAAIRAGCKVPDYVVQSLFFLGAAIGTYGTLYYSFYEKSFLFPITWTMKEFRLLSTIETSLMKDSVIWLKT